MSQSKLLIDLEGQNKLRILRLYDKQFNDLKLLKYQLCKKNGLGIFFFLKRNNSKNDEEGHDNEFSNISGNHKGVHLFVVEDMDLIGAKIEYELPLIDEETNFWVMSDLETINTSVPRRRFDLNEKEYIELKKPHDPNHFMKCVKLNACTDTSVYFDMVHDLGAPLQYMVPFIFNEPELICNNVLESLPEHDYQKKISFFRPYFCMLNLEKMKSYLLKAKGFKESKECSIKSWLNTHKITSFQSNEQLQQLLEKSNLDNKHTTAPLFCRSSNWEKGLHSESLNQYWPIEKLIKFYKGQQSRYSSRFKFGVP